MTAQMDTFKQENSSTTHLIGQHWQKLIDLIESRPGDNETKSFDGGGGGCGGGGGGGGSQYQYRAEDNILRTLQDVKRLRQKDMALFGRCPETDNFYTVVCSICSMILMPHALKDHWEKRHADEKSFSPGDKQALDFPNRSKSKRILPLERKSEKVDKSKKVKSSPLPEPTEETFKDSKRADKSKKGKPVEKPFESENLTSGRTDRGKPKGSRPATESQPIAALSPIQVAENGGEGNEGKELSRTRRRDKRKSERKVDKAYDPDKHCGVVNETGKPCVRSILCKVHQVAMKRAVSDRTMPYDTLIRVLRSQNDDEKVKGENGLGRLPKAESNDSIVSETCELQNVDASLPNVELNKGWTSDHSIKPEEPPTKRLKIKEETVEEDVDQSQFTLPSHLEALIDETLKTLKDVDEGEALPIIPVAPKPEPLVKWNFEPEVTPRTPSPPPHLVFDDIHWHSSHPKPLATNTFGCRLIGGLMSTCKKLDTLRKHLQSVWSSSTSSPPPIRSSFNDGYNTSCTQNVNASNANAKNNAGFSKYGKKTNQNRGGGLGRRSASSAQGKGSSVKRKRRSNSSVIAPVQNSTSNASDIISGLLISNPVTVQRTGSSSVPTIPTGVIPVNSITGNGVPLRLFQGSLPVIASAAPNQPATFIQLNLCPPK